MITVGAPQVKADKGWWLVFFFLWIQIVLVFPSSRLRQSRFCLR